MTESPNKVQLIWDEGALLIVNCPDALLSILTIFEKRLVCDKTTGWVRQPKGVAVPCYNVISENPKVVQTYQGFWKKCMDKLRKMGFDVVFSDQRVNPMPVPRLELMNGFRFSQRSLLTKFLMHDCSGILVAPTRYGKVYLMTNVLKAYPGKTTVVAIPGVDLLRQTYDHLKKSLPHREVVMLGGGSRKRNPSEDITVCSMDSLHLCDFGRTDLLILDEIHTSVTEGRIHIINKFDRARRLGFTATPGGRFDGRDALIEGLIGPVLEERTYLEAVAEGAICPLSVLFLKVEINRENLIYNRDKAYEKLCFLNNGIGSEVKKMCHDLIPKDWQTLIFIKNEKQADHLIEFVGEEGTIAMAKKLTDKQRKEMMERMQSNDIKRCIATNIYSQGVTFPDIRSMINCEGGGNNASAIQKPGRLAEIKPGKKCGIVIDFLYDTDPTIPSANLQEYVDTPGMAWANLIRDSRSRKKAYEKKGYEVKVAENFDELKKLFNERI